MSEIKTATELMKIDQNFQTKREKLINQIRKEASVPKVFVLAEGNAEFVVYLVDVEK